MPSKKTRAIAKLKARNSDLKKTVTKGRRQLAVADKKLEGVEARAGRWKSKALELRAAATRADARIGELQRQLDLTTAEPAHVPDSTDSTEPAPTHPPHESTAHAGRSVPDRTWTVVQLRAEARARGIAGLSNKRKAQLLAALT